MAVEPHHATERAFPVIAIGASAGGLEACSALLKVLPGDLRAALVLILHLDPSHDSMMVALLTRDTGLRVVLAADGMILQPGHLYVIPPGVFLTVSQGVLHTLRPSSGKSVRLPFDVLLRSLAKDRPASLACIVLSGTGTDGSGGLRAIHGAGGLIIAQDPAEAAYSGMPDSAMATGLVDHVLRIADMPAVLGKLMPVPRTGAAPADARAVGQAGQKADVHAATQAGVHAGAGAPGGNPGFDAIIALVAKAAPQDVSLYKSGTIQRRIARRMALADCAPRETDRYLALLRADKAELDRLAADLLIHVTRFFRDPAVFDHLSAVALPALIAAQPAGKPLRIWVAGCSTGEEAYSLAMICIEAMEAAGFDGGLQVFASDIDPEAIATARDGFYPQEIETAVTPERLTRFFRPEGGGWRVRSELRDVIVFTVADLLTDPPFSRIDLVSCRNVLIYLEPEAQRRVIGLCCFALRRGGLLLLGTAETPGAGDSRFEVLDKAARLWRCVGQGRAGDLLAAPGTREGRTIESPAQTSRRTALADLCRRIVLAHYAPAAVLVTRRLETLYLLGPTERYLSITQGHPDPGFLGMLPKPLHARFRAAAATCNAGNPRVVVPGLRSDKEGPFNIELHAVSSDSEQLLLACFVNAPRPAPPAAGEGRQDGADVARIAELEADLKSSRDDLQNALRDLEQEVDAHAAETAEALSVNEEFQSTNEELLASKEELQALNEELTALNAQLQETLERHRTLANDLQNVLYSTDVATLFLDLDLNIRFFTPAARAVFRVIPSDIGRPLADLASLSKDENLAADAQAVLASADAIEREVAGANGLWFLRRVQPYRGDGGQVEGVVITFVDITERKRSHAALVAAKREADRATIAKSRFLAAASHDLRQPLQSLALLHGLMARGKRSAEAVRLSGLLDRTLGSMTDMLDSLLDVNRIESGILRPDVQAVAIAPILDRLADEFGPLCALKGLRLRRVSCRCWVMTDPQLLEQILRNLLSNALKFTPKGRILLGCRRKGAQLTVHVTDTGIGVSSSEQAAIFNDYHQVAKPASSAGQGLGLGLSIVKRLSKLLDHPVALRSVLGRGSTFTVTLPLVAAVPAAPPEAAPVRTVAPRQTGTILLVEDDPDLRFLMTELLAGEGHAVIARESTADALAWAASAVEPPDLVLTDFDLKGGPSGLTLAQDLPDVLGMDVPTIIMTGDITTETLQAIAATRFDHVSKPVLPVTLLARISRTLQATRSDRAKAHAVPAGAGKLTLHVVDDDPMIRETTRRLFQSEGWAVVTYASAEAFLAAPRPVAPTCLIVDAVLPGISGVAMLERLQAENTALPAVILTGHGDAAMAVSAMKAGALDLIEKPARSADLVARVTQAMEQATDDRARNATRRDAQEAFADLTPRERDVLRMVLDGAPNKIIAADLGINQRTVENHRAAVMRKTRASSIPELVRLALAAGPLPS